MEESHFLDMIRAVQPHVSGRPKRSVDLMLQSADLLSCVRQYQEPSLFACDASSDAIDLEAVLMDLQPICNPAEAELVNLILNFFRSRKIYSAYQAAAQQVSAPSTDAPEHETVSQTAAQTTMQTAAQWENPDEEGKKDEPQGKNPWKNVMENPAFQSLLSPSQKENLNQIGTIMQALS